jgi:DNA uptake protein ComE-like DNA-binding protein
MPRRGSVVVVVVWSVAIAAVLVAATQIASFRQAAMGREALARVEARWSARAGVEQMIAIMEYHLQNPDADDPMAVVRDLEAHAVGETPSGTWSISHFNDGVEWAGPCDEASKLNINTATRLQLMELPNMTPDVVDAIIDWRDANDTVESLGAEADYYLNRGMGYEPRNGPFRSVAELELVAGAWPKYVRGEDWNLNGRLDPNEDDGPRSFPDDKPDGVLDAGWSKYLTATSRQSRVSTSGNEKFPLQGADAETLMKTTGVDEGQAKALAAWAATGNARAETLLVTPLSQLSSSAAGGRAGSGSSSGGSRPSGGRGMNPTQGGAGAAMTGRSGTDSRAPAGDARSGRSSAGASAAGSGAPQAQDLDATQLRALLRETSGDNFAQPVQGRININTASASLLKEVLQLDPRVADTIIARRKASPGGITSVADLQGLPGLDPGALVQMAQQFDVTGNVYTVTSRGRASSTGSQVDIEVVVDRSELPARIVSYRER